MQHRDLIQLQQSDWHRTRDFFYAMYNRDMNSVVKQIKEKLTIEEVISSYIKLEKSGTNLKGKCPFHNEKTPSFFVSPDRGSYYCFGCSAKGDIFSFVEQFEGIDFKGALKLLADRAGVAYTPYSKQNFAGGSGYGAGNDNSYTDEKSEKDQLYAVMESATKFFQAEYKKNKEAQSYVAGRGITEQTALDFEIGYAPNEWHSLHTHLVKNGFSDAVMEKAGLIKSPDVGEVVKTTKRYYDRFRDRIMFPISDSTGRVIAFSGRILHDDGKSAKYLNSPQTPLYDKSTVLYGIHKAKTEIRLKNYSILVEGQMDLVLSHQAGIRNTVAVSGTALAEDPLYTHHLALVKRLSSNVILAFDSDGAGRKAALRSSRIAISMGMDVKIADLPDGKDPADLVRDDKSLWINALKEAKPVIIFIVDAVLKESTNERTLPKLIVEKVIPFVAELRSNTEQAHAISYINGKTGLSEVALWEDLKKAIADAKEKARLSAGANALVSSNNGIAQASVLQNAQGMSGAYGAQSSQNSQGVQKNNSYSRVDSVARKLFGLIQLLEKQTQAGGENKVDNSAVIKKISDDMQRIMGVESFEKVKESLIPHMQELLFEAEVTYGESGFALELPELMHTLEIDTVKNEISSAMAQLTKAEASKDQKTSAEIMKRCHELSIRLRELSVKGV